MPAGYVAYRKQQITEAARLDDRARQRFVEDQAAASNARAETLEQQRRDELADATTRANNKDFRDRYAAAAAQIANDKVAIRLAGVYAMAQLADEWGNADLHQRQVCVDVLCAYLRMPWSIGRSPSIRSAARRGAGQRRGRRAATSNGVQAETHTRDVAEEYQVRITLVQTIAAHLQKTRAPGAAWWACRFDLSGARIPNLEFDNVRIEGSFEATGVVVIGDASCDGAEFAGDTRFEDATFSGGARFERTMFSGGVRFDNATFNREVAFLDATFQKSASFRRVQFLGDARFGRARFDGSVAFIGAAFANSVGFQDVEFIAGSGFDEANFLADVSFQGARFSQIVQFMRVTFDGDAGFESAAFGGGAFFVGTTFGRVAAFWGAQFAAETEFGSATFCALAGFSNSKFLGPANFSNASFAKDARFNDTTFGASARFTRAKFDGTMSLSRARFEGAVNFARAIFAGGLIVQELIRDRPAGGEALVLGEVTRPDGSVESAGSIVRPLLLIAPP